MKRKLLAVILICALLALTACTQEPAPEEHLVFLYFDSQAEGSFTAHDNAGNRWVVHGDYDSFYACTWLRYSGEPAVREDGSYEVTADRAWMWVKSDKSFFGEALDTCEFDYDGDGTAELCVISRIEGAEPGQFELTVWDGNTREHRTLFYSSGSLEAMAFQFEEDKLYIRSVDWPYGAENWEIVTYNVRWQANGPVVSKPGS